MRAGTAAVIAAALLGVAGGVAAEPTETPSTTEVVLSGMVTEEVEPGVRWVVNDGVRNLDSRVFGYPSAMLDATPDGGIWLSGDEGRHGLFRLGEERVFDDPVAWPPYREVAPDGSLWAVGEVSDFNDGLYSFDGEAWTLRATTTDTFGPLAIGPDGTVWVVGLDQNRHCPGVEDGDCPGTVLLRLEDDGSMTTFDGWADVYDGEPSWYQLAVSPDGDVWLVGERRFTQTAEALLRFDGSEWERIPPPGGFLHAGAGRSLDFGPDGTLWAHAGSPSEGYSDGSGLARFDGSGWTVFGEADGVRPWGGQGFISTDLLTIAPDGSLWMNGAPDAGGCGGVVHYDGSRWSQYLQVSCVHDLAITPDGSVWVRADRHRVAFEDPSWDVGLYVISPKAEAAGG